MTNEFPDLEKFKNKVIDLILVSGAILAILAQIAVFIRDYPDNVGIAFAIQCLFILGGCLLAFYRKKVKLYYKISYLVLGLYLIMLSALVNIGFLASSKVYIVLGPVVASFGFSFRKSVFALLFSLTIYGIIGYLHINGTLKVSYDVEGFITRPESWLADGVILFLGTFCLLYVGNNYQKGILGSIEYIRGQNISLKKSEEQYKKLVLAFPDIIMVSNMKGDIVYGNKNLENIVGITKEDYKNPNRKARIHPEDLHILKNAKTELLANDSIQSKVIENRFIDHWGDLHWFSGTMTKLYLNDELHFQIVTRDITEKKKTELELANYRKNLEALVKDKTNDLEATNEELQVTNEELYIKNNIINDQNTELKSALEELKETQLQLIQTEKMASLGTLTAGVAHEINNPLNYINGAYLALLNNMNEEGGNDENNTKALLGSIKIGVERISSIVKSLGQFSRENQRYDEDCDLHSILDNCLVMLNDQIKHHAKVKKEYLKDPIVIKGNVGKLHQVFINILMNASQAIEGKGEISIATHKFDSTVRVEISDSGVGISKKYLNQITDPFFTTKPPGQGTGLGLSITYNLLKEHQGKMMFESEKNKGTKVLITLPANSYVSVT